MGFECLISLLVASLLFIAGSDSFSPSSLRRQDIGFGQEPVPERRTDNCPNSSDIILTKAYSLRGTFGDTPCGEQIKDEISGSDVTLFLKPCTGHGHMRHENTSHRYEYCNGSHWISMCPCPYHLQEQPTATKNDQIKSCNDWYIRGDGKLKSGPYRIAPRSEEFQVFCDMETAGGGWTLVAKVKGLDNDMNRANTDQWRDGKRIGDTTNLKDENALGLAYNTVPFRDVMLRSLTDPEKHLAWRHPFSFPNIRDIVQKCERIDNGVKISGAISKLDYYGKRQYHFGCTELVYGFMGGDSRHKYTTVAGCPKSHRSGHVGAIIGAFLDKNARKPGKRYHNRRCVSDFGVGGGYKYMDSIKDKFAINAHWWGKGNRHTNCWKSQAVFIR